VKRKEEDSVEFENEIEEVMNVDDESSGSTG
jgi:hypothetical protein